MTRWNLRTTLPCLALCLATLTMVGCFGGGVKTYDLTPKQLPHEIAWLKVEEEKQNNRFTGTVKAMENGHCTVEVDGRPIHALAVNVDAVGDQTA